MSELGSFLFDLKRQFWVDVAAVVAGAVRQLGVAVLGTANVRNRPQSMMRPPLALSRLADSLYGLHNELLRGQSAAKHQSWRNRPGWIKSCKKATAGVDPPLLFRGKYVRRKARFCQVGGVL